MMILAIRIYFVNSFDSSMTIPGIEAPRIFRMPISLARLAERAVDGFMKLIHAIKRINSAIKERME